MRSDILILPVILALGGCASEAGPTVFMANADLSATPATLPVSGADASLMVAQMPAPGGLVTKVREKTYPNGVIQQAVLGGDVAGLGENHLEISVQTAPSNGGAGLLSIGRPSEEGVKREIIARYPKLQMRIVTQPRQNALGVFGLAIGRAGNGARCIFAWQWVDDIRRGARSDSGVSLLGMHFGGGASAAGALPASIRVHMCRTDATVDDMAATVEGLTLAAPGVVARALDPSRGAGATIPVSASGSGGVTIASAAPPGSLESALAPQKPVAVAAAPQPRRKVHVAHHRAPVEPRQDTAEEGVVPAAQPVYAAQPAYMGGPRYLAPVAGTPAAAPMVYANPAPMAAAAPQASQLDPSLPAAAYRGPAGGN